MPLSLPDSLSARESAFFLDFDGTLAELAETPNDVRLSARARAVLDGLVQASNGAVAVISGRSIEGLDALLAPLKLPLAGVHGAERRAARRAGRCPESGAGGFARRRAAGCAGGGSIYSPARQKGV